MNRLIGRVACVVGAVLLVLGLSPALGGVAVADTTTQISANALTSHDCDDSEWHFVITQVADGQAPPSIEVSWADGGTATVPLDQVTGGTAHYSTTEHLNSTVTATTADIDSSWSGQFNLSHGPCASENGGDENGGGETGGGENGGGENGGGENGGGGVGHTPVNVCHATGSATNPYVFIIVDDDSTEFQGHLQHRTEARNDNTGRDFIGDYTDANGVLHTYDGEIDGLEDCPGVTTPPSSAEASGSFTLTCPSASAQSLVAAVGTLDAAGVAGHFELRVTAGANTTVHTVMSNDEVSGIPLGATVSLWFVPDSGSASQVGDSQTGATTCGGGTNTKAASGDFTVLCDASGTSNAVATVSTLSTGTESGTFALSINGTGQAVTSGQVVDDVPLNATLVLTFTASGGSATELAAHTSPMVCGTTTTPSGAGPTQVGEAPQGGVAPVTAVSGGVAPVTEVKGVKHGRSVPSAGQASSGVETGVSPESAGFLPHTGAPAVGWLFVVGGLLLLVGAGLLVAPELLHRGGGRATQMND